MSFKDKLSSFLFGRREEEEEEAALPEQAHPVEEAPAAPETAPDSPSRLELPLDHPIRQLHDLRQRESGPLPLPRLNMDEDGVIPLETIQKEKSRLQSSLKSVCATRWKAARSRTRGKHSRKKAEAEADEEQLILDARPWFYISSDKLYVWMLALPPVGEGEELTRDMIYQELAAQGVSYGLDTALLDRVSHERDRYFTLYLVATGTPAFDGRNGNIVDYFPRAIQRMMDVDEFGHVDYTSLNLICNVKEGQEICHLIHPTEGEPGRTVLNQEIPAKSGKTVPLPKGRNTDISEDGDTLIASIPGHVEFTGHSFQVKPVLDIDGDVDFSTGSVKFVGDVNIKGDILSGFSVQAMGNVYVGGVIESGCSVEAGGDLTVVKGILGDGSTTIRASRCVFVKYIENATISVKENLQTDCIINSSVYCDGEVLVRSGRGSIIGGQTWSAKRISANILGAKSEVRTAVSLGGRPCANFERDLLRQTMRELSKELENLGNRPDSSVKYNLMGKVRMRLSVTEHKLKLLEEELEADAADPKEQDSARLECGVAYVGSEIRFGGQFLRLKQETHQCVAKLLCDEIVMM